MSYSRGAMLSLIVSSPLVYLRSRRKKLMLVGALGVAVMVPIMAGEQIRERFFTLSQTEADESAQSRLGSWAAAIAIAKDYPVFGVGVRNSNLLSYQYGADMEGRTIHSQYLQTLADSGFAGLALYLFAIFSVVRGLHRVQAHTKARWDEDPEARRVYALAAGLECALALFCFGAAFLSLEVFELPYVLLLMGAELPLVALPRPGAASAAPAPLAPAEPAAERAAGGPP
jgi:probable O-glycosylation ligase (exosortase A-associated)